MSVIATPMFNIMAGNRKTHTTRRNVYRKASGERSARSRQGKTGSGFIRKLVRRYPRWAWWAGGLCVSVFYVWIFYYFLLDRSDSVGVRYMVMRSILKVMKSME